MKKHLLPACLIFSATLSGLGAPAHEPQKPNIVFILADDLGYMDVAAYAAKVRGVERSACYYETPNIDKLVDQGVAFSQAYVFQLCSPSRSAILTGKNPSRIGVTTAWFETLTNYYNQGLTPPPGYHPLDSIHFDKIKVQQAWKNGRVLQGLPSGQPMDQGWNELCLPEVLTNYDSAFLGKWHLGGAGVVGYQPKDQGFKDVLAYLDSGASRHFGWRPDWTPGAWTGWPGWSHIRNQPRAHGFYPLPEPGSPYLADALTDLAVDYIHRRAQTPADPFLLYFCHYEVHEPLQARPEDIKFFQNKSTRGWNGQTNAVYAGMIKALDDSVGRVVQALKDTGQLDNTIIVFLSDNGGLMGPTVNAPLRDGKAFLYEGGVRAPLVISWPKHFAPAWCDVPVCAATDIMPTLAALTGSQVPATDKIDGESLVPLLTDPADSAGGYQVKPIYWSYPFNCALNDPETGLPLPPASSVRAGDYKLIWNWAGTLELYDIAHDIGEQHNLAAAKPELALQLYHQLVDWLDQNVERRYLPTPNPDYQPDQDSRRLLYPFRDLRQDLLNLTNAPGLPNAMDQNSEQRPAPASAAQTQPSRNK
ncbi:MAG TPA: sulfatase [bacterium]|nr:sulfatase [bacterium]